MRKIPYSRDVEFFWQTSGYRGMQSIEALKKLAVFDRERIEHVVSRHRELRLAEDFQGMAEFYAGHASLELLGNPKQFTYAGVYLGRAGVVDALRRMGTEVEFLDSETLDMLIDHDRAMMRNRVRVRHRGTGKALSHEIWDIFRFEAGLIVHQVKFIDLKSFDALSGSRY